MIDKSILIRLKQSDEKAFESVFWEYNPRIYHFALSLLYDKTLAEDVAQSVFLKIWEKREMIDPQQSFEAYLYTIARHLVYKETEKCLNETSLDLTDTTELSDDSFVEKTLEADSLREFINQLIERLPPARREIFRMSRIQHLSQKEIAEKLSISEKTVETQLYRALRFLKEELKSNRLLIASFILAILK